jgi:basic membrane lipoprotein Med (substrate-binding protein (PBP1-ABC) superfamily)
MDDLFVKQMRGDTMREDYYKAKRLAEKSVRKAESEGRYPYLTSLQSFLPDYLTMSKVPVGVREIPLRMIAGTVNDDRQNAFSYNFLPIFESNTEFALKWSVLYDAQESEGIHDAVKCYEYMHRFYVEEGNKRVSVLSYVGAYSIAADVQRILPKKTDDPEVVAYYEFLDFFKVTNLYDVYLTGIGDYDKLASMYDMNLKDPWPEDTVLQLRADYRLFEKVFLKHGGEKLSMTPGDAFLKYLTIYPNSHLTEETEAETEKKIAKIWNELISSASSDEEIAVVENPKGTDQNPSEKALFVTKTYTVEKPLRIAFIHSKNPDDSRWIYAHELGRNEVNEKFGGTVEALSFCDCDTDEKVDKAFDAASCDLDEVVFTTSPDLMDASMRAAIRYPQLKILNCSINLKSSAVRTYYPKLYEAKFLMGALAARFTEDHRLGYVADYPLNGNIININAFAIGAAVVDPKVKIYLSWTGKKDSNWEKELEDELDLRVISGPDAIRPSADNHKYGLYMRDNNGNVKILAAPITHWGKFYSAIIQTILDGKWNERENTDKTQPLNYWFGIGSGVVDVIWSDDLSYYSRKFIEIMKSGIINDSIEPFRGEIHSQNGLINEQGSGLLNYEQLISMEWLNDNIIGEIPKASELVDSVQKTVLTSGVRETMKPSDS